MGIVKHLQPYSNGNSQPALRIRDMQKKIALHTQEGIHLVDWREIVFCHADNNYTRITLASGEIILISKTLAKMESVLPKQHFVRVHASIIVSISIIRQVKKDKILIKDGTALSMSRSGKKLMDKLMARMTVSP